MKIFLPNSADLRNITGLLKRFDPEDDSILEFGMHNRFVAVHPVVLAMTASLAAHVQKNGGRVVGSAESVASLPYMIRMGLFKFLKIDPGMEIKEHDETGRFIPITQIQNADELRSAIADLVPLLHAPPEVADPIRYVFSEMVRNALEHSESDVGVFVCAQYYKDSGRVSIGIADVGQGVLASMQRSHTVETDEMAINLALQPGITGVTRRIGGNEFNAGAGLFFTKSIATLSVNWFFIYSGSSMFRLMKTGKGKVPVLQSDPTRDPHKVEQLPPWPGTVVAMDLKVEEGIEFSELISKIRESYHLDVKTKKNYANKIRFS